MNPVVTMPCLRLDAEPVRVVVVRRQQPRAVLADGSPVALTDPRCAISLDGTREGATVFREYVALRADTLEPVVLSFSGACEQLARTLNVLLELPKLAHAGRSRKRIIGEFATFA
jgi:hypothetical protein